MARTLSLVYGVAFVLAALAGFFWVTPIHHDAPPLAVATGYGLAMGLLPVNILHNIVHLLFGALGLAAYAGMMSARGYMKLVGGSVPGARRARADPRHVHDVRADPHLRQRRVVSRPRGAARGLRGIRRSALVRALSAPKPGTPTSTLVPTHRRAPGSDRRPIRSRPARDGTASISASTRDRSPRASWPATLAGADPEPRKE